MTTPEDRELLEEVAKGNAWLRSVLCTLARRGTKIRREQPERAAELLDALAVWPWFKAGQFLFDLMEWEDFMVDGPVPPELPSALDALAWERLARRLRELQGLLDGAARQDADLLGVAEQLHISVAEAAAELPPLEPGMHLYRDVALGVVASAGPALRARRNLGG